MTTTQIVKLQHRNELAANYSPSLVLLVAERAYESDTKKWKTGDGVTAWSALAYDVDPAPKPTNLASALAGIYATQKNSDGSTTLVGVPSGVPTLVAYPLASGTVTIPTTGNSYTADHQMTAAETVAAGAGLTEGASYSVRILGDGTHGLTFASTVRLLAGIFNPANINLLDTKVRGGQLYALITDTGVALDTTAPVIGTPHVEDGARTVIALPITEPNSPTLNGTAAGVTLSGAAANGKAVAAVAVAGGSLNVTLSAALAYGDSISVALAAGMVKDAAGNLSAAKSATAVTNNIAAPTSSLSIVSSPVHTGTYDLTAAPGMVDYFHAWGFTSAAYRSTSAGGSGAQAFAFTGSTAPGFNGSVGFLPAYSDAAGTLPQYGYQTQVVATGASSGEFHWEYSRPLQPGTYTVEVSSLAYGNEGLGFQLQASLDDGTAAAPLPYPNSTQACAKVHVTVGAATTLRIRGVGNGTSGQLHAGVFVVFSGNV